MTRLTKSRYAGPVLFDQLLIQNTYLRQKNDLNKPLNQRHHFTVNRPSYLGHVIVSRKFCQISRLFTATTFETFVSWGFRMLSIVQQERTKNNGRTAQTKYEISSNAQNDKHMLDK